MRRTLTVSGAVLLSLALAGPTIGAVSAPPDPVAPIVSVATARPTAPPARAAAGAAVTLGQIAPAGYMGVCGGPNAVLVQAATAPTTNPYTVPGAGVITSASYFATPQVTGSLRVLFVKPGVAANQWDIVERTPLLAQTPNSVNTWPLRIPVPAQTRLGLFMPASNVACNIPGAVAGDNWSVAAGQDPTAATVTLAPPAGTVLLNISAVWEPDVDGDGFGDVSQDACPEGAGQQNECTPSVTIVKAPKKKSSKRKAKITFVSSVAGSTFTCKVDKKAAKACTSPFKKKLKYGKHTVVVTATGPVGVVSAPVTVKFKIKKPKG